MLSCRISTLLAQRVSIASVSTSISRRFSSSSQQCPFLSGQQPQLSGQRLMVVKCPSPSASASASKLICARPRISTGVTRTQTQTQTQPFSSGARAKEPDLSLHPLFPRRDGLDDIANTKWRMGDGPPDYRRGDTTYMKERIAAWTDPHSVDNVLSNLIKTLEMELTSKPDPAQWVSMAPEVFRYRANDGAWVYTAEAVEKGSYNITLNKADPRLYDTSLSFEDSHEMFFNAFRRGFIFEVLKVYSAPPSTVGFTWRHWGAFDGDFNGNAGAGQEINIYGFGTAEVQMPSESDSRIRIKQFEVYYDMERFLAELNGVAHESVPDAGFGFHR